MTRDPQWERVYDSATYASPRLAAWRQRETFVRWWLRREAWATAVRLAGGAA